MAQAAVREHYDWLMYVFTTWAATGDLQHPGAFMTANAFKALLTRAKVIDDVCKAADVDAIFQVRAFVSVSSFLLQDFY